MSNTDSLCDGEAAYASDSPYAMAQGARLRLFGDFALLASDETTVVINNRRACGLIAFLYLEPAQSASRERLCGLLWSDRGETQAHANLRQCLLHLRSVLSIARLDLLDVGRQRVSLRPGSLRSDLHDLKSALAGGDPRAAALALGNRRPLLDGLEIDGLFGEWSHQTRARFEQTIRLEARALLARLESTGEWEGVGAVADAYLHRDPLDEAVAAAAIRADAATGNPAAAHRRYRYLHEALSRELGVTPGSAARDALNRVATQTPRATRTSTDGMRPAPPALGPPLVVVAAFEAAGSSEDTGRLASILRDEIVAGLSRFRDLRVITDPRGMDRIGADVSVQRAGDYLLGANLRGLGADARLVVQLIRLETRHVVWSDRLSVSGARMVETIDNTIAVTVGAVLPSINADLLQSPSRLPGHLAYQRYLAARGAALSASTFEAASAAARELEALIDEHAGFTLPYLALAALYDTDFGYTRAAPAAPVSEVARSTSPNGRSASIGATPTLTPPPAGATCGSSSGSRPARTLSGRSTSTRSTPAGSW